MTKMMKKKNMVWKNGRIVNKKNGKVYKMPIDVSTQMEAVDVLFQKIAYLVNQDEEKPTPSLKDFKPIQDMGAYTIETDTPHLDKMVQESLDIVGDIKKANVAKTISILAARYSELLEWMDDDEVLPGIYSGKVNLPVIGDRVLEISGQDMIETIGAAVSDLMNKHGVVDIDEVLLGKEKNSFKTLRDCDGDLKLPNIYKEGLGL